MKQVGEIAHGNAAAFVIESNCKRGGKNAIEPERVLRFAGQFIYGFQ